MSACIGTPISWLRLERYHIGEISADEKKAIDEHVTACAACAASLARIVEDVAPLAPLRLREEKDAKGREEKDAEKSGKSEKSDPARVHFLRRALPIVGTLAAAAAILFVLGKNPGGGEPIVEGPRVKGDGTSFALVRDDEALIEEAGGSFHDGDRFKVTVTCAPGAHPHFDLVVWDADGASFPLHPANDLACGNRVALPGAFRVTGASRMTVCLLASDAGAIDRERVKREGLAAMPKDACKTLDPSP
jgi:hypothetical protein